MRQILLSLTVLVGVAGLAAAASAAPLPREELAGPARVQTVQYEHEGRAREEWRHRREEAWHRHRVIERDHAEHRRVPNVW